MFKNCRLRPWGTPVNLVSIALLGMLACGKQKPAFQDDIHPAGVIPGEDGPGDVVSDPTNGMESVEKVFFATELADAALDFAWGGDEVVQDITMNGQTSQDAVTYQQKIRAQKTEIFSQGTLDSIGQETFQQNSQTMGVLDILVVVDNSGSMTEEQANLSTKLSPLLQEVSQSDWRIGVVTTDTNDGCLRALINKNDANPTAAFAQAVTAGIKGSGNERGIYQAVSALQGQCAGGSWLRSNSTLAVLIVSDEDNCSNGQGCTGADRSGDYLLDYLASIRQVGVNARVYGLVWHASQTQDMCSTAYNRADIYSDVISRSQGDWGSICSNDYTDTLAKISTNISVILKNQFVLKFAPLVDQLEVFVNGQLMSSGYKVVGKVVEFDSAPTEGAEIRFSYKYRAKDPVARFTLMGAADSNGLEVFIDGNPVDAGNFQYDAATRTIDFGTPPVGSEIKVVYRDGSALMDSFMVPADIDVASLEVRVNQQLVDGGQYQYDAKNQWVKFNQAPVDGASIQISFSRSGGPQLRYPLILGEVVAVTNEQGQDVAYTVEDKALVIDASDFAAGRHLYVHYSSPIGPDGVVPTQFPVLADTLEVVSALSGACPSDKIVVTEQRVDLSGCGFAAGERISMTFQYVSAHKTTFEMSEEPFTNTALPWVVYVNDEATTNFQRQGGTLIFGELPYGARVVVKAVMVKLY